MALSDEAICHVFGSRRFDLEDESTNVAWLAVPTFGESFHHNHHAFPRSAAHGLGRRETDPAAMFIWTLETLEIAHKSCASRPSASARSSSARSPPSPLPLGPLYLVVDDPGQRGADVLRDHSDWRMTSVAYSAARLRSGRFFQVSRSISVDTSRSSMK